VDDDPPARGLPPALSEAVAPQGGAPVTQRPYATRGNGGVVRVWLPPPDPPALVAEIEPPEAVALAVDLLRAAGLELGAELERVQRASKDSGSSSTPRGAAKAGHGVNG